MSRRLLKKGREQAKPEDKQSEQQDPYPAFKALILPDFHQVHELLDVQLRELPHL